MILSPNSLFLKSAEPTVRSIEQHLKRALAHQLVHSKTMVDRILQGLKVRCYKTQKQGKHQMLAESGKL